MKKTFTIETYGCQMNEYESDVVKAALEKQGYVLTEKEDSADAVILNTCSVREHAENRAFNKLHVLSREKKNGRKGLILGLMGCMADNYKEKLLKDFPELDFIAGTRNVMDVARLVKEIEERRKAAVIARRTPQAADAVWSSAGRALGRTAPRGWRGEAISGLEIASARLGTLPRNDVNVIPAPTRNAVASSTGEETSPLLDPRFRGDDMQLMAVSKEGWWEEYADVIPKTDGVRVFLPIMTGCDNLCTYCIVPKTRGREVSMRGGQVVDQVKKLVDAGYKEIQLLGQNVNSYGRRYVGESESYRTRKEPNRFPELVAAVAEVPGIERVSWMTSHPKDASRELFEVMRDYPKVTHWFHLPLQSGSDRILKRMGREYILDCYRERLQLMRELIPDVSITSDFIVGFSDETEEDFEQTIKAVREFQFDSAFIFKYSLRKGTPGERLADNVPIEVKEKRHGELLTIQKEISRKKNTAWLGRTEDVLLSGRGRQSDGELIGEMRNHKRVIVKGPESWIGTVKKIKLTALENETFYGTSEFI